MIYTSVILGVIPLLIGNLQLMFKQVKTKVIALIEAKLEIKV